MLSDYCNVEEHGKEYVRASGGVAGAAPDHLRQRHNGQATSAGMTQTKDPELVDAVLLRMYRQMFLYYFPLRVVLPFLDTVLIMYHLIWVHGIVHRYAIGMPGLESAAHFATSPGDPSQPLLYKQDFVQFYMTGCMGMNVLHGYFCMVVWHRGRGRKWKQGASNV